MIQLMKLPVQRGSAPLRFAKGHFVTNHSHINYYIDITYQKTRLSEAKDSAYELVKHFINDTPVDTILCLDGTQIIGAYLAQELNRSGFMSINAHQTIYIITPEYDGFGQMIFRDNIHFSKCSRNTGNFPEVEFITVLHPDIRYVINIASSRINQYLPVSIDNKISTTAMLYPFRYGTIAPLDIGYHAYLFPYRTVFAHVVENGFHRYRHLCICQSFDKNTHCYLLIKPDLEVQSPIQDNMSVLIAGLSVLYRMG